eukprot:TRINITY_DN85147_c0_g1_i1.p3 TRINITY_DN85147_c0_g1~~TRINITY_DN85147_c0_g1_i1.p3  ORF type:complete len:138 (-),score=25.19 TRINITY_DN85147_c0_g1_i1:157-570(-)
MSRGKQSSQKKETAQERRARIEANRKSQESAPYAFAALGGILIVTFVVLLLMSRNLFGSTAPPEQVVVSDENIDIQNKAADMQNEMIKQLQGLPQDQLKELSEKLQDMSQEEIQQYVKELLMKKFQAGEIGGNIEDL